jgi:hypothetical protein
MIILFVSDEVEWMWQEEAYCKVISSMPRLRNAMKYIRIESLWGKM